ncbi:MAG: helix-turn-helix domain-containing protein [Candidatus Binataceae bacterium]
MPLNEVAEYLHRNPSTVYWLIRKGELPAFGMSHTTVWTENKLMNGSRAVPTLVRSRPPQTGQHLLEPGTRSA